MKIEVKQNRKKNLMQFFIFLVEKMFIKVRGILLSIILLQMTFIMGFSQSDTIKLGRSTGLQLSGFARIDYLYDTRQTSEAVEGLFTFYPLNEQLDPNGKDINAQPVANLISVASRLSARFFAPDVFGAKSTAYIEFDFTGTSNTNGVRMRQAYTNFAWTKSALLIGRTWHPLSAGCMPTIVALNTGAPFWAFNRSDMLRFDYDLGYVLISAAALYQSDYASLGPAPGTASTSVKNPIYLRQALLPEFTFHTAFKTQTFRLGAIGSMKTIKPRLYTMSDYTDLSGARYKTDETLTTYATQVYAQYRIGGLELKAQATYSQNVAESLMLGGYAVSDKNSDTGHEKYTPTQHLNYWINVNYGKRWQVGMFAGYLNSLGTLENVTENGAWFARANDIKYMYRISPHLFLNINNLQIAAEVEYTAAAYGKVLNDQKAKIIDTSEVANIRTNLMICFYF